MTKKHAFFYLLELLTAICFILCSILIDKNKELWYNSREYKRIGCYIKEV